VDLFFNSIFENDLARTIFLGLSTIITLPIPSLILVASGDNEGESGYNEAGSEDNEADPDTDEEDIRLGQDLSDESDDSDTTRDLKQQTREKKNQFDKSKIDRYKQVERLAKLEDMPEDRRKESHFEDEEAARERLIDMDKELGAQRAELHNLKDQIASRINAKEAAEGTDEAAEGVYEAAEGSDEATKGADETAKGADETAEASNKRKRESSDVGDDGGRKGQTPIEFTMEKESSELPSLFDDLE